MGTSGAASRTAATVSATTCSWGKPLKMPTEATEPSRPAASANASGGVFAPNSITRWPRPRNGPARRATGSPWWSPATVPSTIAPRFRPRRVKCGPSRPTSRAAITLAWCSSATVVSPCFQDSPTWRIASVMMSRLRSSALTPPARASSTTRVAPPSSAASRRSVSRALWSTRRRDRGLGSGLDVDLDPGVGIVGSDLPHPVVLHRRQQPGAHPAVDGHVVQAESVGGLLQRQRVSSHDHDYD